MKELWNMKKKILAVGLAVLTVITTWQSGLLSMAYSKIGEDVGKYVNSGGSIAQVFTAGEKTGETGYEKLSKIEFNLKGTPGDTVNYTLAAYQNLTSEFDPTSAADGKASGTYSGSARFNDEGVAYVTVNSSDWASSDLANVSFKNGETFAIVATLSLADGATGDRISYSGSDRSSGGEGWEKASPNGEWNGVGEIFSVATEPQDKENIPKVDVTVNGKEEIYVVMGVGDAAAYSLNPAVTPAYKRDFDYTFDRAGVADVVKGKIVAKEAGRTNLTVSAKDGPNGANATVHVMAVKAELSPEKTERGSAPTVTVTYGNNSGSTTQEQLNFVNGATTAESTHFTAVCGDVTKAGDASVTITGKEDAWDGYFCYKDFKATLDFTVKATDIEDIAQRGQYTLTADGTLLTAILTDHTLGDEAKVLTEGTDYTVSVQTGTPTTDKTVTHTVVVTGIGNYTGTASVSRTVTVGQGDAGTLDINSVFRAKLTGGSNFTYTKKPIEPPVEIYLRGGDGAPLDADFVASTFYIRYDSDTVNAGNKTVVVTAKEDGIYSGSITLSYNIKKKSIAAADIEVKLSGDNIHTGQEIKPTVKVSMTAADGSSRLLSQNEDYNVSYENNIDIGNATVKIMGDGNFIGNRTESWTIIGDFSKDVVLELGDEIRDSGDGYDFSYSVEYTGESQEPPVYVYMGSKSNPMPLNDAAEKGSDGDYKIEYDATGVGKGKIIITGLNQYAGEGNVLVATFNITPKQLVAPRAKMTIKAPGWVYDGEAHELTAEQIEVTYDGSLLTYGTDYKVSCENNKKAGAVTVTVTGVGNYGGELTASTAIAPRMLSRDDVNFTFGDLEVGSDGIPKQSYTGKEVTPFVKVVYKGVQLEAGTDYTISYANNVDITREGALATATVTGRGNFAGSVVLEFEIAAIPFSGLTFLMEGKPVTVVGENEMQAEYSTVYNGYAHTPAVLVKDGERILNLPGGSAEYTKNYSNNTNAGKTAYVSIKAGSQTNYAGEVKIYFTIEPKDLGDAASDIDVKVVGTEDPDKDGYILPKLIVTDTTLRTTLAVGKDYKIVPKTGCKQTGRNNVALIVGIGNYQGELEKTFTIGKDLEVEGMTEVVLVHPFDDSIIWRKNDSGMYRAPYLGAKTAPDIRVTYDGVRLTEKQDGDRTGDYTVKRVSVVSGNDIYTAKKLNEVLVTITGQGQYFGEITLRYRVDRASLVGTSQYSFDVNKQDVDATIVTDADGKKIFAYPYSGRAVDVSKSLQVVYNVGGSETITLEEGENKDYVLTYAPVGPEVRDYTVSITGIGNYEGTIEQAYQIKKVSLSDTRITARVAQENYTYTGNPITPGVVVTDNKIGNLTRGQDYIIKEYRDNTAITPDGQSACVVLEGIGNYEDKIELPFTIIARNIEDTTKAIVADIPDYTYDENPITPEISISYDGRALEKDVDYECSYFENVRPGEAKAVIVGKGTYMGTRTVTFRIIGDIGDELLFRLWDKGAQEGSEYTIDSQGILEGFANNLYDAVGITYKDPTASGAQIRLGDADISIEKVRCNAPGKGQLVIRGTGFFKGSRTVNIRIFGNMRDVTTDLRADYNYTGKKITPRPTVKFGDRELEYGEDYELEYGDDNTSVGTGTGTVTIKAKGGDDCNYTGQTTRSFNIKYNLSGAVVTGLEAAGYPYTGAAITPTVTVSCAGQELTLGADYLVEYQNNVNAGTATVVITPADEASETVTGSCQRTFTIHAINLAENGGRDIDFMLGNQEPYSEVYTGNNITPQETVIYTGGGDSRTLKRGMDYTITYQNNRNVGTATAKITGTGNYTGSLEKEFTIEAKNIAEDDVTKTVSEMGYAGGQPVTPTVALQYKTFTLKQGTDFTFTAHNNTDVTTTAYVEIKGEGNYKGTAKVYFTINQTDLSKGGMVTVDAGKLSAEYTGAVITPKITVTCPLGAGQVYTLKEGTDYTSQVISGGEIRDVGTYKIQIVGIGNFVNFLTVDYQVTPRPMTAAEIEITPSTSGVKYDSANQPLPTVTVKDGLRKDSEGNALVLKEGTEYKVAYEHTDKAAGADDEDVNARPTIVITGLGNYGESKEIYFSIGESMEGAKEHLYDPFAGYEPQYVYNGNFQKPLVQLRLKDEAGKWVDLTEGTDFEVIYPEDTVNAGEKEITIKGMGNYYGKKVATYQILPKSLVWEEMEVSLDLLKDGDNYVTTYTGEKLEPKVRAVDLSINGGVELEQGIDYDVIYYNNERAGGAGNLAYAVIVFKRNYDMGGDTYPIPFVIQPRSLAAHTQVTLEKETYEYTGKAIEPKVEVTFDNGIEPVAELVEGTDYTVAIENNVNAGEALVTVTGKGNYAGTAEKSFIICADLEQAIITTTQPFYNGKTGEAAEKPVVTVACGGNMLTLGEDYTLEFYSDNDYTVSGKVLITASGSRFYTGKREVEYNIIFDASLLRVTNYANEYTYTGSAIRPAFGLQTPQGTPLDGCIGEVRYISGNVESDDGSAASADCVNVGDVTAVIPVTVGPYTAKLYAHYRIIPRNINICDVIQLQNNTYVGRAVEPPVIVRHNGNDLARGTDFSVTYKNNVNPGTADAMVKGKGNFTGTKTLHFKIISADMINLKAAPLSSTSILLSWTKNAHVTGYQIYSGDCRTLYGATSGNSYVVQGLAAATDYAFMVRSYVVAGGKTTYGAFESVISYTDLEAAPLAAATVATGKASLSWTASANVTGYEIYRSASREGTYAKIAVMPKSAGGYTDANLNSGRTYYYKIRPYKAVNGTYVYGPYSAVVAIKVK